MAALPNIGGALCSNFNAAKFGARLGRKVNFVPGKILLGLPGKNRRKCISAPAIETAKHSAKFGWLPLTDVAAVTKPRREIR